ncbi:MAG: ABC transporter substrate-binding protein [Candidatus Hermodarchaeota archaeon]
MSTNNKTPKKKLPKKEGRLLKKKPIIAFGTVAIVAIAGIIGGIFLFMQPSEENPNLIIGTNCGIWGSIDPLGTQVPTDYDIISQVAEGLFDHDVATNGSLLIHNLAINHAWSNDYLNLTCNIRQGVKFHDGTVFNAVAVKWNIDRIYNLIDLGMAGTFLFDWLIPNGTKFINGTKVANSAMRIINDTVIIDDYTIRFVLNERYLPLPALLASVHSYILSPASTPYNDFIPTIGGDLVGTGPFIYEQYIPNDKILLSSNPSYWGGQPKTNKLIYSIITNKTARYEALLSGEVSMLTSFNHLYDSTLDCIYYDDSIDVDSFFDDPSIIIQEGPPVFHFTYLIMNNKLIPVEMREAISYALNYSSIIQEVINGYGVRLKSPIPEGMLYSNITDVEYPYYNVSKARQVLKDAGWPGTINLTANNDITTGNEWEMLVTNNTPLETYNFTYTSDDILSILIAPLLANNLKQIGIKLNATIIDFLKAWYIYTEQYGYHLNMIELSILGYNGPKFNDPCSIINWMYSNKTIDLNYAQVNDKSVQLWMEEALEEPNENIRSQIYYDIQKHLLEEVFPVCYLYRKSFLRIFRSNVKGWQVHQFKSNFKAIYF